MTSTQQEIANIDKQIQTILAGRPGLVQSEAEWRNQSKVACDQTLKSKREACQADKLWKKANADSALAQIQNIDKAVMELTATKKQLATRLESENKQAEVLASQGLSNGALIAEAEGKSQALLIEADGKAKATTTTAEADAQSKQIQTIAIVVVVLVVVTVLAIVLKKRLAKTPKK